jgi:hypothetical protein
VQKIVELEADPSPFNLRVEKTHCENRTEKEVISGCLKTAWWLLG